LTLCYINNISLIGRVATARRTTEPPTTRFLVSRGAFFVACTVSPRGWRCNRLERQSAMLCLWSTIDIVSVRADCKANTIYKSSSEYMWSELWLTIIRTEPRRLLFTFGSFCVWTTLIAFGPPLRGGPNYGWTTPSEPNSTVHARTHYKLRNKNSFDGRSTNFVL
jgi:hypothetical protein